MSHTKLLKQIKDVPYFYIENSLFEGNIEKEFNYSITDINGRIISTQKLRGNTLNIQKLISGIYFIQIDGLEVFRFVKK